MPFSFKPDITQPEGGNAPLAPQTPSASFGATSSQSLSERTTEEGKSLVQLLLMGITGLTILACVGLVGYKFYLSSQVESKKATLASYESRLAALPLEDMRKLSNRIKLINQLVKEHPSVNVAFRILEDSIENEVTYTGFNLRYNDSAKNYLLELKSIAPNYRSIAQQIDTYKRKPYTNYVSSISVDGLMPDDRGNIAFTLRMPVAISGLLPEDLQLSESLIPVMQPEEIVTGATTTQGGIPGAGPATGTSSPVTGTTTRP